MMDFPFHVEAKVVGVSDSNSYFFLSSRNRIASAKLPFVWKEKLLEVRLLHLISQGIDVGNIRFLFHVLPLVGKKRKRNQMVPVFASEPSIVPLQALVLSESIFQGLRDSRYSEEDLSDEHLPEGSQVIYLGQQGYGSIGTVLAPTKKTPPEAILLDLRCLPSDPLIGHRVVTSFRDNYLSSGQVSRILRISPLALSRLTGMLPFKPGNVDLGLGIKHTRRDLLMAGYVRKIPPQREGAKPGWEYSQRSIDLLKSYQSNFPELFEGINQDAKVDVFDGHEIFKGHPEKVMEASKWLAAQSFSHMTLVPADSVTLSQEAINELERQISDFVASKRGQTSQRRVDAFPGELLRPSFLPSEASKFHLGDRVVYASDTGGIPLGHVGTIVTLRGDWGEVLFDQEFLSGTNLHGRCKGMRGSGLELRLLLNLSNPQVTVPPAKILKAPPKAVELPSNPFALLDGTVGVTE